MKNDFFRKFIRVMSIALLALGLFFIGKEFYNRYKSKTQVNAEQNLSEDIAKITSLNDENNDKEKEIKASNEYINKMRKELGNDDVIGRLEFEKLGLDHVLVKSHDNEEYLNLDTKGNWFYSGSIFLDKDNEEDFSGFNSRIYGHRLLDGTFFGSFNKFFDQKFVDQGNNTFRITSKAGIKNYDIIAVLDIDPYESNLPLNAEEGFLKSLKEDSVTDFGYSDFEIDSSNRLVSLVSCKPMGLEHSTRRIVIVGLEK